MAEPSLYKEAPTVAVVDGRPTLNTDTVGVATTAVSPTGATVIPNWLVPYFLAGAGALAIVGDEIANPAPWNAQRGIGLAVKLVGYLALGSTQGVRKAQ